MKRNSSLDLTWVAEMPRDFKRRDSSPERQAELDLMASRLPGFYREIADRVMTMEDIITPYRVLLRKVDSENEFLESTWPDYETDQKMLLEIYRKIIAIDNSIIGDEVAQILGLVRARIGVP